MPIFDHHCDAKLRRHQRVARGWTAIETHSTDGSPDGTTIIYLCPACRPMLRDLFAWPNAEALLGSTQASEEPSRGDPGDSPPGRTRETVSLT